MRIRIFQFWIFPSISILNLKNSKPKIFWFLSHLKKSLLTKNYSTISSIKSKNLSRTISLPETPFLKKFRDSNDRTLKRIIFPNFFATFCQLKVDLPEINKFFHSLRVFARSTYCTFIFSMRLEDEVLRNNLRFIFDYVLSLEVLKSKEIFLEEVFC